MPRLLRSLSALAVPVAVAAVLAQASCADNSTATKDALDAAQRQNEQLQEEVKQQSKELEEQAKHQSSELQESAQDAEQAAADLNAALAAAEQLQQSAGAASKRAKAKASLALKALETSEYLTAEQKRQLAAAQAALGQ